MIAIRKSEERGHFDHGWLNTFHTFSFGAYRDPRHVGFSVLRVMNEDRVQPGSGFGTHGHRDMEIISYVLDGALEHRDSMGNGSVLRRGWFQRMTAGRGVEHSEFNHSPSDPLHFYQIWIIPEREGIEPGYEERDFSSTIEGGWQLVASRDGRNGSLTVHQDVDIHLARLVAGEQCDRDLRSGRRVWLQMVRGAVRLQDALLSAGDGVAVTDESSLTLLPESDAEMLLFDLP